MKNKAVKLIALILVFSFVFALSACKEDKNETSTTTTSEQTSSSAKQTTEDIPSENVTTTLVDETTDEPSTATDETTTATTAAVTAPVGGSIADIVAFYNQYANATKEYPGKVTVRRQSGTVTTISEFEIGFLRGALQSVLDNQLKDEDKTKTFANGNDLDNSSETLASFLPRGKGQKMSNLVASGVKSASCTTDGNGWKVVITLKKEVMNGLSIAPPYHSSVMDPITIDDDSMDPFTLGNGQVTYGQIEAPNNGGTVTAKVNANGYLDSLVIDAPLQIAGELGYQGKLNLDTVIDGKFWGNMTFSYAS